MIHLSERCAEQGSPQPIHSNVKEKGWCGKEKQIFPTKELKIPEKDVIKSWLKDTLEKV